MKSCTVLAGVITAGIASSAHAAFTGWTVESRGNIGGVDVYQVFANFDDPTDEAISCIYHRVESGSMAGVQHNDLLASSGGSWNPALTLLPDQIANDSFVTMTGLTGAQSFTNFDPSFGSALGPSIPYNAGWFNSNPSASIVVGANLRIMMMQVALMPGSAGYSAFLRLAYRDVPGSTVPAFGSGTYTIPAPGVATLLLAAGTLGRRRRAH